MDRLTLLMVLAVWMMEACAEDWPFGDVGAGVTMVDEAERVGLANKQVGILFRKSDGALLGIWSRAGGNLLAPAVKAPLWSVEIIPDGATDPAVLDAGSAKKVELAVSGGPDARTLRGVYHAAGTGATACTVKIEARLRDDSPFVRWGIEVPETKGGKLWSVTCPQVAVAARDAGPSDNCIAVPYRRGEERLYGKGAPRTEIPLPYPGAAAKFQFMAAYGKTSGSGLYYAAEDGEAYTKSFLLKNDPAANAIVFGAQHFPADRGRSVRRWSVPYEMVTGPFVGDWWHAARIYREWWVKQVWASKGLIEERPDVPDWAKRSPIVVRFDTVGPDRTAAQNLSGCRALNDALRCAPFFGIWYGYPDSPVRNQGLDHWGHGHLLPPKPGVVEAVCDLKAQGIYAQAYIQSIILVADLIGDDRAAVEGAVTRDRQGKIVLYSEDKGRQSGLWAMCRASEWWQSRMVELSRKAVGECGFTGVYLDSFGKGAAECFAPNHGHPLGGGNTVVAGQRRMAERIRQAIRALNPEAIMSGEDPIEAFRDLLDVHLYAVNVTKDYVPIFRTVWGDYSLGHGRTIRDVKDSHTIIPELAVLFLEGTIMGRFFCNTPDQPILQPEHARELAFLKSLIHYTQRGLPYLRFGEYLHPLKLTPAFPTVEFKEAVKEQKVVLPVVLHSVTRSHADGSVAIVLVNIGDALQRVSVPVDPGLRGSSAQEASLARMDEEGKLTPIGSGARPWVQPITLQPLEVAFLILR